MHFDKHIRNKKVREVESMCSKFHIICLLETHGNDVSLNVLLRKCRRSHKLFVSSCIESSGETKEVSGGLAVLVSNQLANCEFKVLEPGRAASLSLANGESACR